MSYFENPQLEYAIEEADFFILSLDGLVTDTEQEQRLAASMALFDRGFEAQIFKDQWARHCAGRHPVDWLPKIVGLDLAGKELARFMEKKDRVFARLIEDRPFAAIVSPSVLSFMDYLKQSLKPLVLVTTASPSDREALLGGNESHLPEGFFDFVIGAEQLAVSSNLNLALYREAEQRLGAGRYVSIEASEHGIKAVRKMAASSTVSQWICVAVRNENSIFQNLSSADFIIESFRSAMPMGSSHHPERRFVTSGARKIPFAYE